MGFTNILTKYKEHLQTTAALIGIITVVLYVFGYVAERIHWNSLGIIEVPANHIEFLYRGGNVAISSLTSIALYFLVTLLHPDIKALLLVVLLALLLITNLSAPGRAIKLPKLSLNLPRDSLLATFILLVVLSVWELSALPESRNNILFQSPITFNSELATSFFESFMGILFLWLIFYWTTHRSRTVQSNKLSEPESACTSDHSFDTSQQASLVIVSSQWMWMNTSTMVPAQEASTTDPASPDSRLVRFLSRVGLIFALILLLGVPVVYGSFRFPYEYPVVQILLTDSAPSSLRTEFGGQVVKMALLYETEKELVAYRKQPAPAIFKITKDNVSAMMVLGNINILTADPAQKN